MTLRAGVVVSTYQSHAVLTPLLTSLAEHEPGLPVIVVDDASPSGPPPVPDGVHLEVQDVNHGYGATCNRGLAWLRQHDVDVVAFLSPDVRLTGPSITELTKHFATRRRMGLATGPVLDSAGNRVPSAWGPVSARRALLFAAGLDQPRMRAAGGSMVRRTVSASDASTVFDDMRIEGHVNAGTMLARVSCLDEVGGFDEDFFLYWEDADLCQRARDAGWRIRLAPCTPFVHADGTSSPELTDEQRWGWFEAGATRYGTKHLVPGQARQLEAALRLGRRLGRARGAHGGGS